MKPSWNDAPEWAQYLAADKDGAWYWYEREPIACDVAFIPEIFTDVDYAPLLNWQDSVESRPEPEASV